MFIFKFIPSIIFILPKQHSLTFLIVQGGWKWILSVFVLEKNLYFVFIFEVYFHRVKKPRLRVLFCFYFQPFKGATLHFGGLRYFLTRIFGDSGLCFFVCKMSFFLWLLSFCSLFSIFRSFNMVCLSRCVDACCLYLGFSEILRFVIYDLFLFLEYSQPFLLRSMSMFNLLGGTFP